MPRDLAAAGLARGGPLFTNPIYATLLPLLFGKVLKKLIFFVSRYSDMFFGRPLLVDLRRML